MKLFNIAIILALCSSCFYQFVDKKVEKNNVNCNEEYIKLIIGEWMIMDYPNFILIISTDSIKYEYQSDKEAYSIEIINNMLNCNDSLPNYPPSNIRILEFGVNNDTIAHHILHVDRQSMEWASGNHLVHLRKR